VLTSTRLENFGSSSLAHHRSLQATRGDLFEIFLFSTPVRRISVSDRFHRALYVFTPRWPRRIQGVNLPFRSPVNLCVYTFIYSTYSFSINFHWHFIVCLGRVGLSFISCTVHSLPYTIRVNVTYVCDITARTTWPSALATPDHADKLRLKNRPGGDFRDCANELRTHVRI
jgi:hypothetical protein